MATVYLVRHGQASFGKANYDQLSPTGWEQGRVLGRWLANRLAPGAFFRGNLERHRDTVEDIHSCVGSQVPGMQLIMGITVF